MHYKKTFIISVAVVIVSCFFVDFTYRKVSGAHPGSTGAPGDNTCAESGCHTGNIVITNDTVVNSLIFPAPDSTYIPGQTYLVKLKVNSPGIERFGFAISALKDVNNSNIGTFTITQSTRTHIITHTVGLDTRYEVTHSSIGTPAAPIGENEWEFNWKAPSTNVGNITFYYATNSTNNNGYKSGDQIRTSTFKLKPNSSASISEFVEEKNVNAYYTSETNQIILNYYLKHDKKVTIKVYDNIGREFFCSANIFKISGEKQEKINLEKNLSGGIYYLSILIDNKTVTKKIIVQ